ncbi:hypothetical protein Trydic_g12657 [Trypoxylus dichotomus]
MTERPAKLHICKSNSELKASLYLVLTDTFDRPVYPIRKDRITHRMLTVPSPSPCILPSAYNDPSVFLHTYPLHFPASFPNSQIKRDGERRHRRDKGDGGRLDLRSFAIVGHRPSPPQPLPPHTSPPPRFGFSPPPPPSSYVSSLSLLFRERLLPSNALRHARTHASIDLSVR